MYLDNKSKNIIVKTQCVLYSLSKLCKSGDIMTTQNKPFDENCLCFFFFLSQNFIHFIIKFRITEIQFCIISTKHDFGTGKIGNKDDLEQLVLIGETFHY